MCWVCLRLARRDLPKTDSQYGGILRNISDQHDGVATRHGDITYRLAPQSAMGSWQRLLAHRLAPYSITVVVLRNTVVTTAPLKIMAEVLHNTTMVAALGNHQNGGPSQHIA